MKKIIIIFILAFSSTVFSQNTQNLVLEKVRKFYFQKSLSCIDKHTSCNFYFNKIEKGVEMNNFFIPLNKVTINYEYSSILSSHVIAFASIDQDCIFNPISKEKINGIKIAFNSKQSCYDFIDLLADLKESLN